MPKPRSEKILQKPIQKEKNCQENRYKSVQIFKSLKRSTTRSSNSPAERSSPKTKAAVTLTQKKRTDLTLRTKQVNRWKTFGNLTTSDEKLLHSLYTKGPAAFGSVKNLQKNTKLQPRKNKQFLAIRNAHKI